MKTRSLTRRAVTSIPDRMLTVVVADRDRVGASLEDLGLGPAVDLGPPHEGGSFSRAWSAWRAPIRGRPGSCTRTRPGARARPCVRAESSRSLAAARADRVRIPMPHISGADVAGEVVDGGGAFATGTRVMLQPGLSCGRCWMCIAGRDNECRDYDVLGYRSRGGYAELVAVPTDNLVPIPDHVDFVAAAAFPLTFLTAWHMLLTRAARAGRRRPGPRRRQRRGTGRRSDRQAARGARHSRPQAPAKHERARELGADTSSTTTATTSLEEIHAATNGRGADIVVEHVGEATWDASVKSLARGRTARHVRRDDRSARRPRSQGPVCAQVSLLGSYMGEKRGSLPRAASLLFEGRLRPAIDEVFSLSRAADAQRRLEGAPVRQDSPGGVTAHCARLSLAKRDEPDPPQPEFVGVVGWRRRRSPAPLSGCCSRSRHGGRRRGRRGSLAARARARQRHLDAFQGLLKYL